MAVRENFGDLVTLMNSVRKTLTNWNELSLSVSIKTCHSHTMLSCKTTVAYFTITCSAKMVHALAVSSVVRDKTNIKMLGVTLTE